METGKVISKDGTPIGYYRAGQGPPLVIVHGTGGSNPLLGWTDVVAALAPHFRLYAMDRRGRGESGDGSPYAVEREYEDVAAVVDAVATETGEPVALLGHSFGGLLALEAARLTPNIRTLLLYEPSMPSIVTPGPEGLASRLQAMLDAGDREGMITAFYLEIAGMQPDMIEQMRSSAAWPSRLATAHTLLREMDAEERYQLDAQRCQEVRMRTFLLAGEESEPALSAGAGALDAVLPDSRLVTLAGQGHIAMYTAPTLFADVLVDLLRQS